MRLEYWLLKIHLCHDRNNLQKSLLSKTWKNLTDLKLLNFSVLYLYIFLHWIQTDVVIRLGAGWFGSKLRSLYWGICWNPNGEMNGKNTSGNQDCWKAGGHCCTFLNRLAENSKFLLNGYCSDSTGLSSWSCLECNLHNNAITISVFKGG